jgi:hypothetical protein
MCAGTRFSKDKGKNQIIKKMVNKNIFMNLNGKSELKGA